MPKLKDIIAPKFLGQLSKKGIPNFMPKLDRNKTYQSDIWSEKTYRVDPDTHVFTTIQEHFGNRLIRSIDLPEGAVVVDIGCFIGEKLWQVNRPSDYLGVGVDIAIPSLKAAAQIDKQGNKFIAADLEKLPFKSKSVDFVMVFDVIEHLTSAERGFAEIARILKPGGQFLLHIPIKDNKWSFFGLKQRFFPKEAKKEYLDVGHAPDRMLSSGQIKKYLSSYGLALKKEIFYNAFFVHFFDREMVKIVANTLVKIFKDKKSKSVTTRSVHTGGVGKLRTFFGKVVVPVLELLSWPDLILSKQKIGNTYFVLARKK